MPQVKFGGRQVNNPTPASYDRFVKMFVGVTGLFLAWMPTNNLVPHGAQDVITPLVNLANSVMLFLLPFFGVQTGTSEIPEKEVTAMEIPKTEPQEIPKRD